MKKRTIKVEHDNDLVSCLMENKLSKNKVKTMVKLGFVSINDKKVVKLPINVKKDDIISIFDNGDLGKGFKIVYEDKNYLIVEKKEGLLTISTLSLNKSIENTLYKEVREYLNKKREYAFIVNRIDRETSGLVVFVKSENLKKRLQSNWNDIVKTRKYVAVVSGKISKNGKIDNFLYEDKNTFVHSTDRGGKRAITNYSVVKSNNKYTMLDVSIETGRKNQIRVHMAEMGNPIVGDKKYYGKDNPLHRLCLHHYEISFTCPISNKLMVFTSNIPKEFDELFR